MAKISASAESVTRVGQGEIKSRALARGRLRPDAPAVTAHHALDDCQPDAGAGELAFAVQALKGAEELVRIRRIESGAVVAYEEGASAVDDSAAELHRRVG